MESTNPKSPSRDRSVDCAPRLNCRVCATTPLHPVLNLNDQPLANQYLPFQSVSVPYDEADPAAKRELPVWPLKLNVCPSCFHLQLSHVIRPEILYKHYLYASGTNKTIAVYFKALADRIDADFEAALARGANSAVKGEKSVCEIASNDGTQLDFFLQKGWKTIGVDPAENLIDALKKKQPPCGHELVCDFWSPQVAKTAFAGRTFDVLLAQNVFAHVDDCHGFMDACQQVMHNDSMLYIQTSQCHMVQRNEFDTIYHEHLSFFSVLSMKRMCEQHGLHLNDVVISDIHGDSFLFIISRQDVPRSVVTAMDKERADGLYQLDTYTKYAQKVHAVVEDLKQALSKARYEGYRLVGYGAAAKGMTLLNFARLTASDLSYIVDDAPLKQGLYCPGSNVPIVSSAHLKADPTSKLIILPLAWNFFNEIQTKVQALLQDSGKQVAFIRYFPNVELTWCFQTPLPNSASVAFSSNRASVLFTGCQVTQASFTDLRGRVMSVDAGATQDALQDNTEGAHAPFEQILVVHNQPEVARGLHYADYKKTVIVMEGSILDVVIDLRAESPTYGQWYMIELSAANGLACSLTIPANFGHGYYSKGASTLVYGICAPSALAKEVRFSLWDKALNIDWPFPVEHRAQLKMNTADQTSPPLAQVEQQILHKQRPPVSLLLIYGGRGFIGRQLIAFLQGEGYQELNADDGDRRSTAVGYFVVSTVAVNSRETVYAEMKKLKPSHVIVSIGRTGGKKPNQPQSVDYLQSADSSILDSNMLDNFYAPYIIALTCQNLGIHCTYMGTSTMFAYDATHKAVDPKWSGFTESDEPNFSDNHYSVVKRYTDTMLRDLHAASGAASTVLNLRLALPITKDRTPRSLLMKLAGFKTLNGPLLPNSITVLPTLFPALLSMLSHHVTGTVNFTNPGAMTHAEILEMYKATVKPDQTWTVVDVQQVAGAVPKPNSRLDTSRLQSLYPGVPTLQQALKEVCVGLRDGTQ